MTRTGPQQIPGAVLDMYFGDGRYSGADMEVDCAVAHTTEGPNLYDYNSGGVAPTVTAVPDFRAQRLVWHQHFDVDESARALVNLPGGVQTNMANAFQIELVGTCDPATHAEWTRDGIEHIYWPEPPDWAIRDLAWLMRWLRDNHSIPLTSGLVFKAYPDSYGADNGVRLSFDAWTRFTGWCGHQHVPENLHGDPGALPINRLLAIAAGSTPDVQEDDMPTAQEVAVAVALDPVLRMYTPEGRPRTDATASLSDYLGGLRISMDQLLAARTADAAAIAALAKLVAQAHGLTAEEVGAAVKAAVDQALAENVVNVHVDVTNPAKES